MGIKENIEKSLKDFSKGSLLETAIDFYESLGYKSEDLISKEIYNFNSTQNFIRENLKKEINKGKCLGDEWNQFQFLFQFSPEDTENTIQSKDNLIKKIDSFLFVSLELKKDHYSRTQLVSITRELNKPFQMPVIILFRYGNVEKRASLSVIDRRKSKSKNPEKAIENVLEKVSLIHNIRLENPHRAHVDIFEDLHLQSLRRNSEISDFIQLYDAWQKVLDLKLLNKRFYEEIFHWYLWASKKAEFPNIKMEAKSDRKKEKYFTEEKDIQNHTSVSLIRLLTRVLFVWFLKEKGLVPDEFFDPAKLKNILRIFNSSNDKSKSYYNAILQNLFFATLNTERNENGMKNRKFASDSKVEKERREEFNIKNLYRHKDAFSISETEILKKFSEIPFLNGGLFECLDKDFAEESKGGEKRYYVYLDGFSREESYSAKIPDYLFFGQEKTENLSEELGNTRGRNTTVNGLIEILNKYKFTIEENTPLEEDVALDPELLGKVFENLLAAYNPETSTTARKQTGSFYTPREIVEYMVDESLKAYFTTALTQGFVGHTVIGTGDTTMFPDAAQKKGQMYLTSPTTDNWKNKEKDLEENWKLLFESDFENPFGKEDTELLVESIYRLKVLDPACGSGAFPMGVLNRLVNLLNKLDPKNNLWEKIQLDYLSEDSKQKIKDIEENKLIAKGMSIQEAKEAALKALNAKKEEILNSFHKHLPNYARKLYLIENCIYGVDIQPIAVQISKLRFFISLVIDQTINEKEPNRGILSLPNLETKFVAANSLIGLEKPKDSFQMKPKGLGAIESELRDVRHKHFSCKERKEKIKLIQDDKKLRKQISVLLIQSNFPKNSANQIADWDPYDQNSHAEWFDPEFMFGVSGGFDIVIGNPPYIQLQKDGGRLTKRYEGLGYTTFSRMGDIYSLFYERGFNLLNSEGYLCYITSNKWMRAGYGENTRKFFAEKTNPILLIDFGHLQIFENATVDTNILIISPSNKKNSRNLSPQGTRIEADFNIHNGIHEYVNRNQLILKNLSSDPWIISNSNILEIKLKIEKLGKVLKDWNISINYGIKTGYNEAFIIDTITKENIVSLCRDKEEKKRTLEILKPILRGRDINRWGPEYVGLWLIFIPWHFPLDSELKIKGASKEAEESLKIKYPTIYEHLKNHEMRLKTRNLAETGIRYEWYALQRWAAEYWNDFEKPKLIFQEIVQESSFLFDEKGFFCNDTGRIIIGDNLKYLLSIMNSKLFFFCIKIYYGGGTLGSEGVRMKHTFFEMFPVKVPSKKEEIIMENLVDKILNLKASSGSGNPVDTSLLEAEIDARVFHLYNLTQEEMNVVLDSFPKLEDKEKNLIRKFYKELG